MLEFRTLVNHWWNGSSNNQLLVSQLPFQVFVVLNEVLLLFQSQMCKPWGMDELWSLYIYKSRLPLEFFLALQIAHYILLIYKACISKLPSNFKHQMFVSSSLNIVTISISNEHVRIACTSNNDSSTTSTKKCVAINPNGAPCKNLKSHV